VSVNEITSADVGVAAIAQAVVPNDDVLRAGGMSVFGEMNIDSGEKILDVVVQRYKTAVARQLRVLR